MYIYDLPIWLPPVSSITAAKLWVWETNQKDYPELPKVHLACGAENDDGAERNPTLGLVLALRSLLRFIPQGGEILIGDLPAGTGFVPTGGYGADLSRTCGWLRCGATVPTGG